MFAVITGVLAIGGFAERARIGPVMVFLFLWLTLVYCPIACWTWNSNGWSFQLGGLDFAGGTPVHISSGTAAFAISVYLGKRRGYGTERLAYKPHNTTYIILGTVFLWFGWFGFNGGSALSANLRAVSACIVTNLAASVAGITWMLWDWRLERKFSAVGFCSGAISGLVGITPASGFVGAPAAVAIGFVTATGCNFATKLKFLLNVDDTLDVFASHGIGGMIGDVMTGLFAQASVAFLDGVTEIPGGWFDRNWIQLGYQIADGEYPFWHSLDNSRLTPPQRVPVSAGHSSSLPSSSGSCTSSPGFDSEQAKRQRLSVSTMPTSESSRTTMSEWTLSSDCTGSIHTHILPPVTCLVGTSSLPTRVPLLLHRRNTCLWTKPSQT